MSRKPIVYSIIIALLVIFGLSWLVLYVGKTKKAPAPEQGQEVSNIPMVVNLNTSSGGATENQDSPQTSDQKTTWYDIPELGMRFPVDQETKDELVYANVSLSRKLSPGENGKTALVYFSTKTLVSFNKNCSASEGPLGSLSRRTGVPLDAYAPCGGGLKVKEFENGYFCYTHAQALCTWTDDDYNRYEKIPTDKYYKLFTSEDFWNTVVIR